MDNNKKKPATKLKGQTESTIDPSVKPKKKTLKQIKQEISIANKFLPFRKERQNLKGYALTGESLRRYKLSIEEYEDLPDLDPEKVQEKLIKEIIDGLTKGHEKVINALESVSFNHISSDDSTLVPRSLVINFTREKSKELGFEFEDGKEIPKEPYKKLKLGKLRSILPPAYFEAPKNIIKNILDQHNGKKDIIESIRLGERAKTENLEEDEVSKINDSTLKTDGLSEDTKFLLQKISDSLEELKQNETDKNGKHQEKLYETLGENFKQEIEYGASDAVGYYDFYDLKIAWPSLYSEILENEYTPIPQYITALGFNDIVKWDKYITNMEAMGGDWRKNINLAADALIYGLLADIYDRPWYYFYFYEKDNDYLGKNISFNDILLADLVAITNITNAYNLVQTACDKCYEYKYNVGDDDLAIFLDSQITSYSSMWTAHKEIVINEIEQIAEFGTATGKVYHNILTDIGYPFLIFTPKSINYGLLVNYRQEWMPMSWQVGDLIETVPLAPKERRKYTKKVNIQKKRSRKEIEDSLSITKSEDADSSRAESQIVQLAQEKTSFEATATAGANAGINVGGVEIGGNAGGSTTFNTSASNDSNDTKKKMRESIAKSAREFKNSRKVELSFEESSSLDEYYENEISNPNEEITVTYLFYELQRRYSVIERLHNVQSVILYANEVPAPTIIDWDWIIKYDWILKRVLLDDSFRPSLDFVLEGKDAMEFKLTALENRKNSLQVILDKVKDTIEKLSLKEDLSEIHLNAMSEIYYANIGNESDSIIEDFAESIFGGGEGGQIEEHKERIEGDLDKLQRIAQKRKAAKDELQMSRNALDRAIEQYNKGVLEKHSKIRQVDRFIEHLKDNIIYYMKAIWSYQPPDQRYLELCDVTVPFVEYPSDEDDIFVRALSRDGTIDNLVPDETFEVILPPPGTPVNRKLVEIADIDNLLGFKGNYMIFPLRKQSYLTAYMAQEYVGGISDKNENPTSSKTISDLFNNDFKVNAQLQENTNVFAMDPDRQMGYSVESMINQLTNEYKLSIPEEIKVKLEDLLKKGLLLPESTPEDIIVPSDSLYIEALPGKHPILEDFKLQHRKIDMQKAIAEKYRLDLENIRSEARLWKLDFSDPDVEKSIKIEGNLDDVDASINT